MMNDLMLLAGNDIPFPGAQVTLHQPTIKEIGYIGEEAFFTGVEYLKFSKDILSEEDRINLERYTDFDILMSMMKQKNVEILKIKVSMEMVLSLIFPEYQIIFNDVILLKKDQESHEINANNFADFKSIISQMFSLDKGDGENTEYNPGGKLAKQIAEKLKKRRQQLAENKPQQKIAILNRYISILAVGLQKDMNSLMNYTVYQLFDEFNRYELKIGYDIYIQAKMAGAKDLKEVEDWMKDLHP